MSNLYSVIPALTPTSAEIVEAELLAKQVLEAEYPTLDLREGTGLRDLVLRPVAYAFALLKKANDYYFAGNSISGVNDSTNSEMVDDILSNWFLTRNTGTQAVINARMFFARSKNVTIPSSVYFSTDGELKFYPSSTQTFQASSLSYDSYQNEYYVDVELVAENPGTQYNIGEGSLLYFTNFDPYFLHGEINYLAQISTDPETNTQFINRASSAISTRNLINRPSVLSNLQETFNMLSRIQVIGYGDFGMIRDQLKAVFDPEAKRTLSSLGQTGGVATATLVNHGYEVGQQVTFTNALPSEYNTSFVITTITANTFTFNISAGVGSVTQLPYVQSKTDPALIHMGGKVDVYCGDDVSTSLVQLTTDSHGVGYLTGPIMSYTRSALSGGVDDDTIPFERTIATQSVSLNANTATLSVTTPTAHGLSNGAVLNVAGVTQTKTLTSLTCENLVVTATLANHGLTTGMKVVVSGATPDGYNGTHTITRINSSTFSYVVSINILENATGTLLISNPEVVNSFPIVYTGTSTFNIVFPVFWANATNSIVDLALTQPTAYTITYPNLITKTLVSLTGSGTIATATLQNHGYAVGRYVTITGATPSYYNGTFKILTVDSNTFTYDTRSTISANATGTLTSTATEPSKDVGFSTRQSLRVDFGAGYANSTATFEIRYFTYVDDVQTYLEQTNVHILCGDYLARGFNVYMLDVDAAVYDVAAPTTDLVFTTTQSFLKTLAPGSVFVLSDLVTELTNAGITNLQTPLGVTYKYYHRDLVAPTSGTILDYLDPLDNTNVFMVNSVNTRSLATQ